MTITVNGTNGLTFSDASTQNTAATGFGFKNRIINGDMRITQRGNVAVSNGAVFYGGADRTFVVAFNFTTASGFITRSALSGTTSGFGQYLANATTTGSGVVIFGQRIESANTIDLNSNSATLTGKLFQDTGGPITATITVRKATVLDNFGGSTQIGGNVLVTVPSGVLTPFSLTTTLGATDANNGLAAEVSLAVGAVSNKNFAISDLQLEKGSTATSFDYRSYGTELALCQRYYEKSFDPNVAPVNGPNTTTFGSEAGSVTMVFPHRGTLVVNGYIGRCRHPFKVTKRVQPSVQMYGNSLGQPYKYGGTQYWCTTGVAPVAGVNGLEMQNEIEGGVTVFTAMVEFHFTASAEL